MPSGPRRAPLTGSSRRSRLAVAARRGDAEGLLAASAATAICHHRKHICLPHCHNRMLFIKLPPLAADAEASSTPTSSGAATTTETYALGKEESGADGNDDK
jgi:hypothetical protein